MITSLSDFSLLIMYLDKKIKQYKINENNKISGKVFFFLQDFLFFPVSSVAQSCLTLYDPMDCSTSGLPDHHQLPEPTQTHVYLVGNAIKSSHPL